MSAERHTFLFCDLVGFTALADAEGDQRAASVAAALRHRVDAVAAEHGAELVKSMGDAAMVRCDEPSAAIRLALTLVDAVETDLELPPIRVGVNTGPAVGHDGDWYGRAVNVAARLCSAAAGGEVLVSEATLAAAEELRRVRLGERRLHWLKNVTEPVAAHAAERNGRAGRLASLLERRPCPLRIGGRAHTAAGGMA